MYIQRSMYNNRNKQERSDCLSKAELLSPLPKCSFFTLTSSICWDLTSADSRTRSCSCPWCSHIRWSLFERGAGFSFAQVSSHSDLLLSLVELCHFARQHLHSSGCEGRRKSGGSNEAVPADPESSGLFLSILCPPQVTSAGCLRNKQLPQAFPKLNKRQILSRELDATVELNSYKQLSRQTFLQNLYHSPCKLIWDCGKCPQNYTTNILEHWPSSL